MPFKVTQAVYAKAVAPVRRQAFLENVTICGQEGMMGLGLANKFVNREVASIAGAFCPEGKSVHVAEANLIERDGGDAGASSSSVVACSGM